MRFPQAFFCCLRGEQNHAFSFMEHEALDQHETHERLAETHAVAEESAAAPTAPIGTGTGFKGNILAGSAITFTGANTSLVGRALAKTAVTMTDALISQ